MRRQTRLGSIEAGNKTARSGEMLRTRCMREDAPGI